MNFHTPVVIVKWDDDRVAKLTELFIAGLSASQIASNLGGVTRNAVIGKIHRLGLNLDHLLTADEKADRMARRKEAQALRLQRQTKRRERQQRKHSPRSTLYQMFVKRPADDMSALAKHIPFIDLEPHHCRFPYGTDAQTGYTFCGHDKIEGSTYCAGHHALCWSPASQRAPSTRPAFRAWA